ncbi:MAG: hypothetical protein F4Y73_04390 [Gemmatimonadetes bacterium]|nr:hypothetical protein [Gemmatimonadota bacterium]
MSARIMTNEQLLTLIASILIPLGSLILVQTRATRQDLKELRGEVADLRRHVDTQIGELRERMAHLEGLLEGLRQAITRRSVA